MSNLHRVVAVLIAGFCVLADSQGQVIHTYWGTASAGLTNSAFLTAWAAGDMDGDGTSEMWIYTRGNGPTLTLYSVSRQFVLFSSAHMPQCGPSGTGNGIASGRDVDGDGWPDYAYQCGGQVLVKSGRTHGQIRAIAGGATAALADGNGDGYCDVLIGNSAGMSLNNTPGYVRLYSGRDGAFLWENSFSTGLGDVVQALGDIDGDGCDDFVSGRYGGTAIYAISGRTGQIVWLIFDPVNFPAQIFPVGSAGDIDHDGRDDVLVNNDDSTIAFYAGRWRVLSGANGSTLLDHFGTVPVGLQGYWGGKGDDWDLDGVPDHVVAGTAAGTPLRAELTIVSGVSGTPLQQHLMPPNETYSFSSGGDFNGDGTIDVLLSAMDRQSACGRCGAIDVFQVRAGPSGSVRPQGHGCPGSDLRLPTATTQGYPRVGQLFGVGLYAAVAFRPTFLAIGNPGGIDLQAYGAPGCRLNTDTFWWELTGTDANGRAAKGFLIPASPALNGLRLDAAWLVLDPPANALGAVTSTGLAITLGV